MGAFNRRQFLVGLLGASATAVAAHFGAPDYMGDEIKAELLKDFDSTSVSFSGVEPFQSRPVWKSVSGTAKVWAEEIGRQVREKYTDAAAEELASVIDRDALLTSQKMARELDARLEKGRVDADQQIIVETPRIQNFSKYGRYDYPKYELAAGVEETQDVWGQKKVRVGFLTHAIEIVDEHGRAFDDA